MKKLPSVKKTKNLWSKGSLFLLLLPLVLPATFLVARYFPRTVVANVTVWERTQAANEILVERVVQSLYSSINRRPYANTYIVRSGIIGDGGPGTTFDVEYNRSAGTLQIYYENDTPGDLYENVTDSAISNLTQELAKPTSIEGTPAFGFSRLPHYGCKLTKRYVP